MKETDLAMRINNETYADYLDSTGSDKANQILHLNHQKINKKFER